MSAELAVAALRQRGWRVATCESMTAGLLCGALTTVPGSSDVVAGGLVTYDADLKVRWAHVDPSVLATSGLVSEMTAQAMAVGVRTSASVDVSIAITGAAGPQGHDGVDAGIVCCGIAGPLGLEETTWNLSGDRDSVRAQAVDAALRFLCNYCAK